jgi:hypothetical protein
MVEKDSAGGLRQNEAGLRLRAGYNLCPCAGVGAGAVELDSLYTRCVLSVPSYEGCCPFGTMDLPLGLVAKICNDNELARGDRLCPWWRADSRALMGCLCGTPSYHTIPYSYRMMIP